MRERDRYIVLKEKERNKEIYDLKLQPKFVFKINDKFVLLKSKGYPNGRKAYYKADFLYRTSDGEIVVEDSKGLDTPISKLKRAIVSAQYGIDIQLV